MYKFSNISDFYLEFKDNTLIVIPKTSLNLLNNDTQITRIITNDIEFLNLDFKNVKILNCLIKHSDDTIISNNINLREILINLWKTFLLQNLLKNTTFNFRLEHENGYIYNDELKLSFEPKDEKNSLKEIINMVQLGSYNINISLILNNNNIINYIYNDIV